MDLEKIKVIKFDHEIINKIGSSDKIKFTIEIQNDNDYNDCMILKKCGLHVKNLSLSPNCKSCYTFTINYSDENYNLYCLELKSIARDIRSLYICRNE